MSVRALVSLYRVRKRSGPSTLNLHTRAMIYSRRANSHRRDHLWPGHIAQFHNSKKNVYSPNLAGKQVSGKYGVPDRTFKRIKSKLQKGETLPPPPPHTHTRHKHKRTLQVVPFVSQNSRTIWAGWRSRSRKRSRSRQFWSELDLDLTKFCQLRLCPGVTDTFLSNTTSLAELMSDCTITLNCRQL